MKSTGLFAAAVTAALLAGCGGSATTPPTAAPASPSNGSATQTQSGARGSLAITLSTGTKSTSATQRSAKQITSDVTDLLINVGGTTTFYPLTGAGSPCTSPSAGSYSCVISEPVGTYNVYAGTATGTTASTAVGYSASQSTTLTVGQTTAVNFVVTPIVKNPALNSLNIILPSDGQPHTAAFQADLVAPNGSVVSSPVDTVNLVGTTTVSVTTGSAHLSVTPPTQPAAAVSGSYNDAWSLSYDGAPMSGFYGMLGITYTKNTSDGADPAATLFNNGLNGSTATGVVYFEDLELPQTTSPSGATFGGNTFSNGAYYIAPGSLANNGTATIGFQNSTTTSTSIALIERNDLASNAASVIMPATPPVSGMAECPAGVATIGSSSGSTNPGAYTTNVTINNTNGTAPCSVTFKNGTFSTLVQNIAVYPPASLTADVMSIRRK